MKNKATKKKIAKKSAEPIKGRLEGWEARLTALIEERRAVPFEWGVNDCGLFAADAVQALTGEDPASHLRGYSTADEAAGLLEHNGGLLELMRHAALGRWHEVAGSQARRGDLMAFANADGSLRLAVCVGASACSPGAAGLVFVPCGQAVKAWRIN